jgi:transcription elongation factor Elf1
MQINSGPYAEVALFSCPYCGRLASSQSRENRSHTYDEMRHKRLRATCRHCGFSDMLDGLSMLGWMELNFTEWRAAAQDTAGVGKKGRKHIRSANPASAQKPAA